MGQIERLPACNFCGAHIAQFKDRQGHDIACYHADARRIRYRAVTVGGPQAGLIQDWSGVPICGKCFGERRHLDFRLAERRLAEINGPSIRRLKAQNNRADPNDTLAMRMASAHIIEIRSIQVPTAGGAEPPGRDWAEVCCQDCRPEWDEEILRYVCAGCGEIHGDKSRL